MSIVKRLGGSGAAKVRHLFGLCKAFGRKVWKWRRFLTVVGCWKYKMRYLQTKVGRLQTILGNVGGWCYLWSIDVGRADLALHNDGPADNNEGMW